MTVFPVGLHLAGRRCLVLGDGPEQARRAQALLEVGAALAVIAVSLDPALRPLAARAELTYEARQPEPSDLSLAWLVVYVGHDPEARARLFAAAERERVFFCAVDQPEASYSHLAQAKSGPLTIALSTQGGAPGLAARLSAELQALLHRSDAEAHVLRLTELRARTAASDRRHVMEAATRGVTISGTIHWGEAPTPTNEG